MKENELRIGNLLQGDKIQLANQGIYSDGIFAITGYGISEFELGRLLKAEPIPLTEEWLLKFGFEIEKDPPVDHWHFGINPHTKDWMILIKSLGSGFFYQNGYFRIPYVHSLQNLYFALTGEELELKY